MITFTAGSPGNAIANGAFYVLSLWLPISGLIFLALGPYLHAPAKTRKEQP